MFTLEQKVDLILRYIATADKNQRADLKKLVVEALNSDIPAAPETPTIPYAEETEDLIFDLLKRIGMPQHIKGYNYVVEAIKLCLANPEYINAITKCLYPEIARKFDTNGSRTERAIRHAIVCTFDRGDLDELAMVFGNTINLRKGKLTNSEFIAFCANDITHKLKKMGKTV